MADLRFNGSTLYAVGRFGNCTIDTVNTSTGAAAAVVGTNGSCSDCSSTLGDPASVTFDASGAMYITEPHANIIRKYRGGI